MRWVIKNPAPSDSRRKKWGDFHFGRSLTKYLERAGDEVVTQYDPGWDEDVPADVVLTLRGKYPFPPDVRHGGALRVMWNISHPADVSLEEYASHDLVCVASRTWASRLSVQVDVPVHPLLQCTDLEEFAPTSDERRDIVFIGNTRDTERPGVLWALDYGIPLKIWGRGWSVFDVSDEHVVADYFPNEELGALYSRSVATLNDHWEDMKAYGFINNRILDALASGTPVVSDWHQELHDELPQGGVLFYRDRDEFDQCMETLLLDHPALLERVAAARQAVHERFGFEHRVAELRSLVERCRTGAVGAG